MLLVCRQRGKVESDLCAVGFLPARLQPYLSPRHARSIIRTQGYNAARQSPESRTEGPGGLRFAIEPGVPYPCPKPYISKVYQRAELSFPLHLF